jgi:hypothetical protein
VIEIEVVPLFSDAGAAVVAAAEALGLRVASDGTLRRYPGSRHWHLKKVGSSGTLEVTHWPAKERLWVSYHANRIGGAGWVAQEARRFAGLLAESHG